MALRLFGNVFIFLTLCNLSLLAQNVSTVDSLKSLLTITSEPAQRIDLLNNLTDKLWHNDPALAIHYADTALQLAKTIEYPKGLGLALANKGVSYYTLGNYEKAAEYCEKSLTVYSEKQFSYEVNLFYINILKKQSRYKELIKFITSMLEENDIHSIDPSYLSLLASTFVELGNVSEAELYIKAILGRTKYKDDSIFYANINSLIFDYLLLKSDYDSAKKTIEPLFKIFESANDELGLAKINMKLGSLKMTLGEVKEAQTMLTKALAIYESLGYLFGVAEAKRNLGNFYFAIGENSLGTQFLFDAEEIYQKQNNLNELAKTYNDLSWIYFEQRSYDPARRFIFKALAISQKIGNKVTEATCYNHYGTLLDKMDSLPAAFDAYKKANELSMLVGDKKRNAATLFNMAWVMEKMDINNPKILEYYISSYEIEKAIGNVLGTAISEYTLGGYYTKINKFELAEFYLDLSRETLIKIKSKQDLLYNYDYSATLYEKLGNFKLANDYHKKYIETKEVLSSDEVMNRLGELEVKYELKNKDREIEFLNLESKSKEQELSIKEKTISNQRLFIGFVIFAILLLLLILILTYQLLIVRNKNNNELKLLNLQIKEQNEEIMAQSEELQEANQQMVNLNQSLEEKVEIRNSELQKAYNELDTFFYRASHDFTGPLTTFMGLTELAKATVANENALHLFEKVGETASKMDRMVKKLRYISLAGAVDLRIDTVDFEKTIKNVLDKNLDFIGVHNFEIKKDINITSEYKGYPEIIEFIFESIIENALIYNSHKHPELNIAINTLASGISISISDNGDGILKQHLPKVFDMFFRASVKSNGNGLGLYLVNKGVARLNGTVEIQSDHGEGTTIKIELPKL